jgi:small subunit ribosomal protein MRP21
LRRPSSLQLPLRLLSTSTIARPPHKYTAMSSRSLGELLLRPSALTRTPLCQIKRISPSWTAQRSISNTSSQPAAQPQRRDDGSDTASQEPTEAQRLPIRRVVPTPKNDASQAIDSLFSGMPRQRGPPTSYAPRGQSTSGDEVRAAARASSVFGAGFSDPSSRRSSFRRGADRAPKLNFDAMSLPTDMLDPNQSNKPSEAANLETQQKETFAMYPRLNATYGRTVELDVSRGRDLVRGIGMLGSLVARNKIKREQQKQRYHERGGLKRKRLNSERWRARFKIGFNNVTRRVSELTSKGW